MDNDIQTDASENLEFPNCPELSDTEENVEDMLGYDTEDANN